MRDPLLNHYEKKYPEDQVQAITKNPLPRYPENRIHACVEYMHNIFLGDEILEVGL